MFKGLEIFFAVFLMFFGNFLLFFLYFFIFGFVFCIFEEGGGGVLKSGGGMGFGSAPAST